ncbi:AraC family transcriptional regulator [uncultured Microbacterium sp.]|uniref:AraC family transcriptional regulator n=1 Tax=uncultured Microbacterium sp. TaxID=191216 RepID=UPI00260F8B8C|nr:AraC family transcriptional regulator [uncultured Microbacterium sp.]
MEKAEGFDHQRLAIVPGPAVAAALSSPVTRRLVVTDAGFFPRAAHHARQRTDGAREAIVIACASGAGWVQTAAGTDRLGAGMVAVIPPGHAHAYGAQAQDPWTIRWCHITGTDVTDLLSAVGAVNAATVHAVRSPERIAGLLDDVVRTLEHGPSTARLIEAAGLAWHLLTRLAVDRVLPVDGGPVERALRHLDEHVDATVRVSELAAAVGVSASHLAAMFRTATGGGILAYHQGVKMAHARRLLDTTTASVAEVGRAVGMDDPFYFSRRFRATHGMSPRAYRALRKG